MGRRGEMCMRGKRSGGKRERKSDLSAVGKEGKEMDVVKGGKVIGREEERGGKSVMYLERRLGEIGRKRRKVLGRGEEK